MSVFEDDLADTARLINAALDRLIPNGEGPEKQVLDAMRYSTLGGGKRIRPFLVMTTADLFNVSRSSSERVAAAIEMVHAYSLVHDDLPAMDDDDLRRGRPTCHMEFDEATAILAGDGLLTLAFEVLAGDDTHCLSEIRAELVLELAQAIGAHGMVGGQMLDLLAADQELDMLEIIRLQKMKTGALISYACQAGAILGKAGENQRHMLAAYAQDLGLAFQIIDDLLDLEGDTEEMGKRTGKDNDAGKATFVSLLGPQQARERANTLTERAIKHLEIFSEKGKLLRDLAEFVVKRRK